MQTPLDLAAQILLIEQVIEQNPFVDWQPLRSRLQALRSLAGLDPLKGIKGQSAYGRVKPRAIGDREATNAAVLRLKNYVIPTVRVG